MARISRHLQELIDAAKQDDRVASARWLTPCPIKFARNFSWYRSIKGDLVRPLADGTMVMLLDGPAGWAILDGRWRMFVPADPLPPGARRSGNQAFFIGEDAARLAADTLPGYWCDPSQEN